MSYSRILVLMASCGLLMGQQCVPANSRNIAIPPPAVDPQPEVTFQTSMGNIVVQLFHLQAPRTVENFLGHVGEAFYDDTIVHEARAGQSITGGAFTTALERKTVDETVENESNNGLRNLRGRIAMVEPEGTGSGTTQFLINLRDNAAADFNPNDGTRGRTVFGKVIRGMEIADAIGAVPTSSRTAEDGTQLSNAPSTQVIIMRAVISTGEILPPLDPPPPPPPPTEDENLPPVASAGLDRTVAAGLTVTLDGSASSDPNPGDELSFLWEQTSGEPVLLSDATAERATFVVPPGEDIRTFTLTVTDLLGLSSTDSVAVTVVEQPHVRLETTMGDVLLEMLTEGAPITTTNFMQYVIDDFYEGTIFHRAIPGFVVQGGGFLPDLTEPEGLRPPIVNEFSPDRSNVRTTVAMAKLGGDPDSATSQFFINLDDNSENLDAQNGGFTVFARVRSGMSVADAISEIPTENRLDPDDNPMSDVPEEDVIVLRATIEGPPPPPEGFTTTASGLLYRDVAPGTGAVVQPDSTIRVLYTGRLYDEEGDIFDSATDADDAPEFPLSGLIEGWQEGLGGIEMREDGTRILIIPPHLGYGDQSQPGIPANSTLWFEIEVLQVLP